jgi:dephospho-CoA kinase
MTEGRLAAILKNQMPDREKRQRADFVVPTGLSRNLSLRRLRAVVGSLRDGRSRIARGGRWPIQGRHRRN